MSQMKFMSMPGTVWMLPNILNEGAFCKSRWLSDPEVWGFDLIAILLQLLVGHPSMLSVGLTKRKVEVMFIGYFLDV